MELSQKQKNSSHFFSAFLKSSLDFKHFFRKDDPHCLFISKITDRENLVRSMPKNSSFKGSFGKEHCKRAQTLLKFAWQHLYQIY